MDENDSTSDSGSSDWARAANYVDGSDSDTGSDSEPVASSGAMLNGAYGDVVPPHGTYNDDMPPCRIGIYDGDDEPHRDCEPYVPPATENSANFWTAPVPASDEPEPEHAMQTATIDLGYSSSEDENAGGGGG